MRERESINKGRKNKIYMMNSTSPVESALKVHNYVGTCLCLCFKREEGFDHVHSTNTNLKY